MTKDLLVDVPLCNAICDGYIDAIVSIAVGIDDNVVRCQNAPPLVIHCSFRPLHESETTSRKDFLSIRKLNGEGTPTETKTILGWFVCSRNFRIYLPLHKRILWCNDIDIILKPKQHITGKQMELTLGCLNHVAYILPHTRYFLNRIRHFVYRCQKYGPQLLDNSTKLDLILWKRLLSKAADQGVSINLITYTIFDEHIDTDASEKGLGGFNPRTGMWWRYELPN